jgi:hypothetical protein
VTLSADNIVQFDEGSVAATAAVVASLPAGTTAGNTVIVFLGAHATGVTAPSGFVGVHSLGTPAYYYKSAVSAAETSWTFTQNTAQDATWVALELSNIDIDPMESTQTSTPTSTSNGGTRTSGTTVPIGLSSVTFAVFLATSSTELKSWDSYTNDFVEITEYDSPSGANRPCVAVAARFTDGTPTPLSCTGTLTIAAGSATASVRTIVFRELGSPVSAPLISLTGFEFGHHGGLAETTVHATGVNQPLGPGSLSATIVPVGTWGTHYQIGAFGRNGDYGMRISTSAATAYVPIGRPAANVGSYGQNIRVISGSGTPTVMTWDVATGTDLLLVYDVATEMFGLRWDAGTVEWQTGTTPLNTWAWVEVRVRTVDTVHRADWWCETGTGDGLQTSPAYLTGQVSTTITKVTLSGLGSQTVTADFDDLVAAGHYAAFPLGPHKVVRLVPEATGSTVFGTSANFSRFTANGTLAALTVDTVGALLDEVPPTVSASADGVVQTAVAASDYIEIPMQTYTLAPNEVIAGVRMIAAMWGGTGTGTGTLEIWGYDGVTVASLMPLRIFDAGSPTEYSATEPLWMARAWGATPGTPWTPTRLNAACIRMGYSNDATPDMGMSAVYLEVATRETVPFVVHRLTDDEDPEAVAAVVTETLHPYNSGVQTYTVSNNDLTRTAVFNYSIGGTPQTPVVVDPGDPPVDVTVGAGAFGEVDSTSFGWQ